MLFQFSQLGLDVRHIVDTCIEDQAIAAIRAVTLAPRDWAYPGHPCNGHTAGGAFLIDYVVNCCVSCI